MVRKISEPSRIESIQAVHDYLTDNGVTEFTANQILHTNWPSLGDYRTLMDEIRDGNWEQVWNSVELYITEGIG